MKWYMITKLKQDLRKIILSILLRTYENERIKAGNMMLSRRK